MNMVKNEAFAMSRDVWNKACDQWQEVSVKLSDEFFSQSRRVLEDYQSMVSFSLDCSQRWLETIEKTSRNNSQVLVNTLRESF